jgi:predicted outer membrane protein
MRRSLHTLILTLVVVGCGAAPRAQEAPAPVTPTDATPLLRPAEVTFVREATDGGRMLAEVSTLGVSQATGSAVRSFAQQLAGDYAQINRALETLARRKSVDLPLQPTSFSDPYRELAQRGGAPFDAAFVRRTAAMSEHELRLCEAAVSASKDPDIRDLAGSLLPTIRAHVNQATELLKAL